MPSFKRPYFISLQILFLLLLESIYGQIFDDPENLVVDYNYGMNLFLKSQHPNFTRIPFSDLDRFIGRQFLDDSKGLTRPKSFELQYSNNNWTFYMSDPTNKTKESCENAKLLVVVFDRPTAFDVRQAIRHAWANSANVPNGVVVKFILGLTENTSIDAQLFNESIIHDDLILSTLKDGYDVIYHKVAAGFHWHQAFCPTKYWMKLDDDMTIDLVRFLYWINHEFDQRHQEHPASVFGELWTDPNIRKVHRSGKWNVTKEQWENDLWPDYMPGACYVMSNEAVKRTIDTMPKAHTMHVEDALYTGIIADIANISKIDATKIIDATETKLPDTVKCYDGVPLFSVYNSMPNNLSVPEEHTRLYNDLVNLKQKCGTKDDTGIPCYFKCNRTDLIDISGPSQTTENRTDIDGASQIVCNIMSITFCVLYHIFIVWSFEFSSIMSSSS